MNKIKPFFYFISFVFFIACQSVTNQADINPPAPGFNLSGSDSTAIRIADEVMAAMGGRQNWDNARFFKWTFFGRRVHYWDKMTGDIRIESAADSLIYLLNLETMIGKVSKGGTVVPVSELAPFLDKAKSLWINDMYWLFMPFKLKDSGVTLKYIGQDSTLGGENADVLQLTFNDVGDTPQNKYLVYVDKDARLVSQWDFYQETSQDTARFQLPWEDYQQYGNLMLSGSRGKARLDDIEVLEEIPEKVFREF